MGSPLPERDPSLPSDGQTGSWPLRKADQDRQTPCYQRIGDRITLFAAALEATSNGEDKILREYERGVIFRLGRLLPYAKGPGIILVFAPVDPHGADFAARQEALEVKPQDIITRDSVTLRVNAVIFLRVIDPRQVVVKVSDYPHQTSQFAQTTLRSVLG